MRLLMVIPTLLGMTIVIFLTMHVSGGDPAIAIVGDRATEDVLNQIRAQLGLDRPLYVQYLSWLWQALQGDLGHSLLTQRPVFQTIMQHLLATVELMAGAMLVAVSLGTVAGILAAMFHRSWIDSASRLLALAGVSFPSFWVGLMFILIFAFYWPILPIAGYGSWRQFILPSLTLGTALSAILMRLIRGGLLEVLQEDYIRTARAKGGGSLRVVVRHGLRNAMLPVVTVLGLQVALLLGGTVAVEAVFSWPGIGRLAYTSMLQRDFPMIMGILLIYGVALVMINLITDMTYAALDPRVRYG